MVKLLLLRALPLVLRPMVILLEGYFVEDGYILVLTLPIAMMALTISSIPVHIDFFRADQNHPDRQAMGEQYVAGLLWVTLLSFMVLAAVLFIADFGMGGGMIVATCLFFVVEKFADEVSRAFEFRKAFIRWFLVQTARSGWLFLPILATFAGIGYETAFLASAVLAAAAFAVLFTKVTQLRYTFDRRGLTAIHANLIYLFGSILPASYRQLPRILVARLFPDQAHIFLATAQLTQAVGLLFNVRFQIPYRQVIARRTRAVEKTLRPSTRQILLIPLFIAPLWLVIDGFLSTQDWNGLPFALLLMPLLVADAVAFAIVSVYLGYLPWFEKRIRVLATYLINAFVLCLVLGFLSLHGLQGSWSVISITAIFIVLGLVWTEVTLFRHFRSRKEGQKQ